MSRTSRMHRSWHHFAAATRFALIEHGRNRFAMVLVALFVPTWITLAHLVIARAPVQFRLRATGEMLRASGNELSQISGALNAATLIIGFMMFAATFVSGDFDRRLAMAGYPRLHLLLAKVTALVIASLAVAVYATAITCQYWSPRRPWLLVVGLFCAAMTYGAFGVTLGALLKREVEGMFTIVMISILDLSLQNPIPNPAADSDFIAYLPSYGAMQASTAAGFSTTVPLADLFLQLAWFIAAALLAFLVFHRRTRSALPAALVAAPIPAQAAAWGAPGAPVATNAVDQA
ncbi:ABC transporter permease [Streptomyces violascens]|uniref:ABC transporter permease n=1 Tax=Streptomyces violascens TaxID=67381 RepID=UPI003799FF65